MKNKWMHMRIKEMLNNKEMTTGQIKEGLWNAKTKKGTIYTSITNAS